MSRFRHYRRANRTWHLRPGAGVGVEPAINAQVAVARGDVCCPCSLVDLLAGGDEVLR